jgi:hypothetical protein
MSIHAWRWPSRYWSTRWPRLTWLAWCRRRVRASAAMPNRSHEPRWLLGRGDLEAKPRTREAAMPSMDSRGTRLLVALCGVVGVVTLTANFFIPPNAPPDTPTPPSWRRLEVDAFLSNVRASRPGQPSGFPRGGWYFDRSALPSILLSLRRSTAYQPGRPAPSRLPVRERLPGRGRPGSGPAVLLEDRTLQAMASSRSSSASSRISASG